MTGSERPPRTLTAALRALSEADAGLGASPVVEARLREAVRGVGAGQRARPSATFLALAAALVVAASGAWRLVVTHPPAAVVTREVATDFLPLTYAHLPVTDAYLVRMEVPRSLLMTFGLTSIEVWSSAQTDTVEADVLVGIDGLARGIGLVRPRKGGE